MDELEKKGKKIVELVKQTDPITQYLLFTQTFTYLGTSLPTAVAMYFVLYFFVKKEEEKPQKIEVPSEPKIEEILIQEPSGPSIFNFFGAFKND